MALISCKGCGAKISDEYSYCTNCLTSLEKESASPAAAKNGIVRIKAEASIVEAPGDQAALHPGLMDWLLTPLNVERTELSRRTKMLSETHQGAVSGAYVGLAHGIVSASVGIIFLSLLEPELTSFLAQEVGPRMLSELPTLWITAIALLIVFVPIIGVISGIVLGIVFVAFKAKIPGSSIIRKSVVFSLILCMIGFLIGSLDLRRVSMVRTVLPSFYPLWETLNLVQYPVFGYLFGYLLQRRLKTQH